MNKRIINLFLIFLRIGAFTFGGGYAMIPLIEEEVVKKNRWLEKGEFLDSLAICQSTPGALAVNSAIFIGYKIRGIPGALVAGLGVIIPSFFIILLIAASFSTIQSYSFIDPIFKGIRTSVVALILTAGIRLLSISYFNVIIILITFSSVAFLGINPFITIIFAALAGILKTYFKEGF